MDKAYYYRQAIFAVNPGACNLSGLARSLGNFLAVAEEELNEVDNIVRETVDKINRAVDIAWEEKRSSLHVNTHPMVRHYVVRLNNMAFVTEDMRQVANHPIIRLVSDQMRQLSGAVTPDEALYTTRWGEAYDRCEELGKLEQQPSMMDDAGLEGTY